jgi:8-oxo-dGTP pyrophosphatase MutT (NUDIX family)
MMELNHETVTTPPVDAASVLLLRDSAQGLQVLLLRRHHNSKVLGGAYVFPGGKLDAEDHAPEALPQLSESPAQLHSRLQEPGLPPARAAGLFMAALREAFEECGVLAGQDDSGPSMAERLRSQGRQHSWHTALRDASLCLRTEALLPWSRWITPRQPSVTNKRFDTRFFLTRVCEEQQAAHDNHETTDSVWLTPEQALGRFAAGEIEMAPPQIMSLYQLKVHRSVAQALDEARQRPPALIEPEPFDEHGKRVICYPGDPRHPVRERALRGPSRLMFDAGRFVPVDGMATLLG